MRDIRISAPSEVVLDSIIVQMIELGAAVAPQEVEDAELRPANQNGVAPGDFLSTTIYPTEVRVQGEWIRVQDQRMDGVIVVDEKQRSARCILFRYLKLGDLVVVGSKGVRTVRKPDSREVPGSMSAQHEFGFMGAGVSSERRVELIVDQIAWEMDRIHRQAGKVVVVPGPVVIHTGGGEHLAWLIREGYVQALLSGNAIAVHDIEQALLGTSLGMDLKMGTSVEGGHRHHLKAINTIRGCGSIAKAVEQGVLTRGVFYECVRRNVPFSLAGSIRDDGPLPDTQMDLIKAQEEYARLIKGADLILMLSSMLHSIGVGNMTPRGCETGLCRYQPAVVTKLSDRGSVESIGVVYGCGIVFEPSHATIGKIAENRESSGGVTIKKFTRFGPLQQTTQPTQLEAEFRMFLKKYGVEYDEAYVWD